MSETPVSALLTEFAKVEDQLLLLSLEKEEASRRLSILEDEKDANRVFESRTPEINKK